MAKKFLTGLTLVNLDSDPLSGSEGELYFNTSASVAKIYKSGAWSELGAGGGSNISVGSTEPINPEIGDGWYDNTNGSFYIYDGTYWVEVNGVVSLTQEQVQDYVAPLFTNATNTNVVATYDDENNVINLNTSGSLVSVDSIVYPDYITFDTTPEIEPADQGSLWWSTDFETLNLQVDDAVTLQIGQEHLVRVKNSSGSAAIPEFTLVMFAGATADTVTVTPAITSDVKVYPSDYIVGITTEEIPADGFGFVTQFGFINKINTSSYPVGTLLYPNPSVPGGFVTSRPLAPAWQTPIAAVTKQDDLTGRIFVRIIPGIQLGSIENVEIISPQDNQALVYNSSSLIWVNENIVNSVDGTDNQISVNNNGIGDVTFSLPNDLITPGNLTVTGDLTVSGSTTFINTEQLNIEDNIITLNSGVTGTPTLDAGIEIERGTEENSSILWDEVNQVWKFSNDIQTAVVRNDESLQISVDSASVTSNLLLNTLNSSINIENSGNIDISLSSGSTTSLFSLNADGTLKFSDNSFQNTAFLGMPSYSTTDLTEGSNLYFTDQRAVDALSSTLSDYITLSSASTTYQPLDSDLTAISALSGSQGNLTTDGLGNWSIDTNQYLTESSASSTYLTQSDATSTYLTQSNAEATYAQQSELSNYLTNANAAIYYQPLDSDLTAISSLSGSAGFLTTDGSGNWLVDQTSYAKDVQGTNGEIEVSSSSGTYTVGLPDDVYITNNLEVGGNLNVSGSISYQNELVISDPLIYIGEDNNADVVDLGVVASFTNGFYQHTGLVRDASDGKWKLFDGVTDEPTSVVNFDQASYDTLLVGSLENSGSTIVLNALQSSGSVDAAIVVERGSDPDVAIKWNETTNKWQYTNDGTNYTDIGSGTGGGGSSSAAVTSDPPTSPELNQVWQDLDTGRIYVWDGTFWIEVQQNGSLGLLRYLGASSTAPTTSIDGSDLQIGEVYFDTVFNSMKVYNGTSWEDAFSAASLSVSRWVKTAIGGETTLSGNDDNLVTLAYTPGIEEVYLNGVKLIRTDDYVATSGSTITIDALPAGAIVEVISYSGFNVANTYTKTEVDQLIQKKGLRWTKVIPVSASVTTLSGFDDYSNNLEYDLGTERVFVNGVLIANALDYSATSGSSIVLNSPLIPGDVVEVTATSPFSIANTYTKAEIDAKDSDIFALALSDEFSNIISGTARVTFRSPFAITLTQNPRASLSTASSSGNVVVDINVNGTSILGENKLSIDANEKTSVTAATATSLATTGINDDDEITIDIDSAGTNAKGLKVVIYYKRA